MYAYRRALLAPMLVLTLSGLASGIANAKETPSAESAAKSSAEPPTAAAEPASAALTTAEPSISCALSSSTSTVHRTRQRHHATCSQRVGQ